MTANDQSSHHLCVSSIYAKLIFDHNTIPTTLTFHQTFRTPAVPVFNTLIRKLDLLGNASFTIDTISIFFICFPVWVPSRCVDFVLEFPSQNEHCYEFWDLKSMVHLEGHKFPKSCRKTQQQTSFKCPTFPWIGPVINYCRINRNSLSIIIYPCFC